jgi:hypothetical protein
VCYPSPVEFKGHWPSYPIFYSNMCSFVLYLWTRPEYVSTSCCCILSKPESNSVFCRVYIAPILIFLHSYKRGILHFGALPTLVHRHAFLWTRPEYVSTSCCCILSKPESINKVWYMCSFTDVDHWSFSAKCCWPYFYCKHILQDLHYIRRSKKRIVDSFF